MSEIHEQFQEQVREHVAEQVQEQVKQSFLERLRAVDWEKDYFGWTVKDLAIAAGVMMMVLVVVWITFFVSLAFPDIKEWGGIKAPAFTCFSHC